MTLELGFLLVTVAITLVNLGMNVQMLRDHERRIKDLEEDKNKRVDRVLAAAAHGGSLV